MMGTATFVKDLDDFAGHASLYRLDPPLKDNWHEDRSYEYVAVSAATVPMSGPETYIFGADEDGEVTSWLELPGSFRGDLNHEEALNGAGYEVSVSVS